MINKVSGASSIGRNNNRLNSVHLGIAFGAYKGKTVADLTECLFSFNLQSERTASYISWLLSNPEIAGKFFSDAMIVRLVMLYVFYSSREKINAAYTKAFTTIINNLSINFGFETYAISKCRSNIAAKYRLPDDSSAKLGLSCNINAILHIVVTGQTVIQVHNNDLTSATDIQLNLPAANTIDEILDRIYTDNKFASTDSAIKITSKIIEQAASIIKVRYVSQDHINSIFPFVYASVSESIKEFIVSACAKEVEKAQKKALQVQKKSTYSSPPIEIMKTVDVPNFTSTLTRKLNI